MRGAVKSHAYTMYLCEVCVGGECIGIYVKEYNKSGVTFTSDVYQAIQFNLCTAAEALCAAIGLNNLAVTSHSFGY
jgi:hypothetical protein